MTTVSAVMDWLRLVNKDRHSLGLKEFETNTLLMEAAQAHAEVMAPLGICGHYDPYTGKGVIDSIKAANLLPEHKEKLRNLGWLIGFMGKELKEAHNIWTAGTDPKAPADYSKKMRAPTYKYVGIGCAKATPPVDKETGKPTTDKYFCYVLVFAEAAPELLPSWRTKLAATVTDYRRSNKATPIKLSESLVEACQSHSDAFVTINTCMRFDPTTGKTLQDRAKEKELILHHVFMSDQTDETPFEVYNRWLRKDAEFAKKICEKEHTLCGFAYTQYSDGKFCFIFALGRETRDPGPAPAETITEEVPVADGPDIAPLKPVAGPGTGPRVRTSPRPHHPKPVEPTTPPRARRSLYAEASDGPATVTLPAIDGSDAAPPAEEEAPAPEPEAEPAPPPPVPRTRSTYHSSFMAPTRSSAVKGSHAYHK